VILTWNPTTKRQDEITAFIGVYRCSSVAKKKILFSLLRKTACKEKEKNICHR